MKIDLSENWKTYLITARGKPRMTQQDKWIKRKRVQQYWDFCRECELAKVQFPPSGAHVVFVLPMPDSWSKQKKQVYDGQAHEQKPDLDNCLKALGDALYSNDSGIWDVRVSKIWGREGKIMIKSD